MKSLILFIVSLIGFVNCDLNCQPTSFNNAFMIFVGDNKNDIVNVSLTSDISRLRGSALFGVVSSYTKYYNPNRQTKIYINGWRAKYDSDDSTAIINAYLAKKQFNIVYIDWYNYTNNFAYVTTLGAIEGVNLITKLISINMIIID